MAGRVLHAALDLLDHQLVDRDGRLCGKVDDVELDRGDDGEMYVAALLCGPGVLLERFDRYRLGRWLQRMVQQAGGGRARIPASTVIEIASSIRVGCDATELASWSTERWMRDHVVAHIPGSAHRVGS